MTKNKADKKKAGRPENTLKTVAKTFCFFKEDIDICKELGHTPKSVFRLGIYSLKNNPILMERIRVLEEGNDKLQQKLTKIYAHINEKLDNYGDKKT